MPTFHGTVPGRECGSCMMCCKVMTIPEMQKAAGAWCPKAVPGKGCSIYETRPQLCRTFWCDWMVNAKLGAEWKPERAKFVLHSSFASAGGRGQMLVLSVDPSFPNAWTKAPYFEMIKKWARDGAAERRFVVIHIESRYIAVLPDRIVEIGKLDEAFTWSLVPKLEAGGVSYGVMINGRLF